MITHISPSLFRALLALNTSRRDPELKKLVLWVHHSGKWIYNNAGPLNPATYFKTWYNCSKHKF